MDDSSNWPHPYDIAFHRDPAKSRKYLKLRQTEVLVFFQPENARGRSLDSSAFRYSGIDEDEKGK
jgi:hypothetical protein